MVVTWWIVFFLPSVLIGKPLGEISQSNNKAVSIGNLSLSMQILHKVADNLANTLLSKLILMLTMILV